MKLKEALEQVQYMDELPLLRQCMVCKEWLDKQSQVIATRTQIEYLISHGLCDNCFENYKEITNPKIK